MKRFNSVNLSIETHHINNLIFANEKKAKTQNFGGFREAGFDKIKSSFFTFVFLCGGDKRTHNSRELLTDILVRNDDVKIIISENLEKFKGNLDLLTFENVLEAVSKMILIPLESFGTSCELGAFTRIDNESNKVVAIIEEKHSKDKSFVNYGPIQLLKEINDDRVFTVSYQHSGENHYMLTNSKIEALHSHSLITSGIKIVKYYSKKNSDDVGLITNLDSFLVAILDYVCLVSFATIDMIMEFFSMRLNDDSFVIRSSSMKIIDNSKIKDVIMSFLHILESINFLYVKDDIFFVDSQVLAPQMKNGERWIGKVLFTNDFTRTDEYLKIKCSCEEIKNRIEKYGHY